MAWDYTLPPGLYPTNASHRPLSIFPQCPHSEENFLSVLTFIPMYITEAPAVPYHCLEQ